MRVQHTIVVLLIALVGTTWSVTGQEEPLPAIKAKGALEPLTPSIVAIEPNRADTRTALVDAARENNYFAFDALYRDALRRNEPVAAFAELHELWTYSITNPIGAYYGIERYEHFARMYPTYPSSIERYRIVDNNGNVFYPASETRAFLLERAIEGPAPKVQVAKKPRAETPDRGAPLATSTATRKPRVAAETPVDKARAVVAEPQTIGAPKLVPQPMAVPNDSGRRGIFLLVIGILGIGILATIMRAPRELSRSIRSPSADKVSAPIEPIKRPSAAPPPRPPSGKNRASGSHG